MIKNTLFSTAQVVTLATGQTYTLKSDEVMLNNQIYKKGDLEIAFYNNTATATPSDVKVGIQKRDGSRNLPADFSEFGEWEIDTVTQTTLALCIENINTALFVIGSSPVASPSVTPFDFGAIENDASTTSNLQAFFDYVRDNNVVGDFRGTWDINATIIIDGTDKTFICGTIETENNVAVQPAVSIETTECIYTGLFSVTGSTAAAYSGKNNRIGLDFTNSGSRNSFDNVEVTGFTGYGLNIFGVGGSTIMENFNKIKITACGSTGSAYTTGSASAIVSAVVNSGSANSVGQTSKMTVDAVDSNWLQFELLEINGKIHTITADPIGLDIIVYPWVDDAFTGTIYGLHGGLMVAGSDSASVVIQQIDAIRCGSGARIGGLYGTKIHMLQTQACGIGLSIGRDEASNNLGSEVTLYNEGSNTFDFCQVSRVNTNTQIHLITGITESKWFVLEAQPATFDASNKRLPIIAFDEAHVHTKKYTEIGKNQLNDASTTIISNNIDRNQAVIFSNDPIFELKWDDAYNDLWGKDLIRCVVFGTGTNGEPTGTITFNLDSADQTAGIRINDGGTPETTLAFSGITNPLNIAIFFDYVSQEWNIAYKGEGVTSVPDLTITNATGGILTANRDDGTVNDLDEIGGVEFRSDDISFAEGDEVLSRFIAVADGAMGTGSNSKVDLIYFARALETQAYTEQVRMTSAGHLLAKKLGITAGFTVAGLPTGAQGDMTFVTDALTPAYLATVGGGGAVITPVFYNGTNWICH